MQDAGRAAMIVRLQCGETCDGQALARKTVAAAAGECDASKRSTAGAGRGRAACSAPPAIYSSHVPRRPCSGGAVACFEQLNLGCQQRGNAMHGMDEAQRAPEMQCSDVEGSVQFHVADACPLEPVCPSEAAPQGRRRQKPLAVAAVAGALMCWRLLGVARRVSQEWLRPRKEMIAE